MAGRAASLAFPSASALPSAGSAPHLPPSDGGQGLRSFLLDQFKSGRMSATTVCTLAWHATAGGATNVADLAHDPASSHQAEVLMRAIGARAASTFFYTDIPLWDHIEEQRVVERFPFDLPHEHFATLFAQKPSDFKVELLDDPYLPEAYRDHAVTTGKGSKACPVGLFSDGVPFTNTDSFIAFYWSNMLTGGRYLICSLRKSDLCQCGCRGFCALGSVQRVIAWSFQCLALG
eukprot:13286691-Alexandrium_andersonii.AAC.1